MYYQPHSGATFALHSDVRRAMPWVLFGDSITDADLASQGMDEQGQVAEPLSIEFVDERWTQLWTVRDATPDELETMKPPVPSEVTMRQARLALLSIGQLDQVAPAIESLVGAERDAARIEWEFSSAVVRSRPLVCMLGLALGLAGARAVRAP